MYRSKGSEQGDQMAKIPNAHTGRDSANTGRDSANNKPTVPDAKDEASSHLTTFWTPFGCYCYLRMPFSISSAPEEFQRRMHTALQGLPGVEVIADDILVYGCGTMDKECQRDHDANYHLLQRA